MTSTYLLMNLVIARPLSAFSLATCKVDIWKTVKISCQQEWLEMCAIFCGDGVKEMMRNASCFINFVPCI